MIGDTVPIILFAEHHSSQPGYHGRYSSRGNLPYRFLHLPFGALGKRCRPEFAILEKGAATFAYAEFIGETAPFYAVLGTANGWVVGMSSFYSKHDLTALLDPLTRGAKQTVVRGHGIPRLSADDVGKLAAMIRVGSDVNKWLEPVCDTGACLPCITYDLPFCEPGVTPKGANMTTLADDLRQRGVPFRRGSKGNSHARQTILCGY